MGPSGCILFLYSIDLKNLAHIVYALSYCVLLLDHLPISFDVTSRNRNVIFKRISSLFASEETHWQLMVRPAVKILSKSWWRHPIETFSPLLAICAGNSPVTGEFHAQRPVTRSFDVFFDLRPNKRLCKQSRCRWFVTPLRSLWRHCNDIFNGIYS